MSEIKVSVIVPVYNCEKYLKTSMGDILTQTYKNIELILVNDGSTDCSYEICKDIASQDSRVKIINKPQSEGAGPARNDGIDASCGEYIMFLDCDDRIESNMVEKLLTASLDNNCDVAICGYETYVEDVENGENDVFSPEKKLYLDNEVKVLFAEYFPEVIVTPLEGTYLMWCNFKCFGLSKDEMTQFLTEECKLYLVQGASFGETGAEYQRINLACPKQILIEALERLLKGAQKRGLYGKTQKREA